MVFVLTILVFAVVLLAGGMLFLLARGASQKGREDSSSKVLVEFQREMGALRGEMNQQLLEFSRQVHEQLNQNNQFLVQSHQGYREAVGQVNHRLGELHQAARSMLDIGKDISSLQNILRAPKLRGTLGELFLAELLRQILPADHFVLQYSFRDGSKVDAVILLGQGLIPVDAKFPLEHFRKMIESPDEEEIQQAKKMFIQDVRKHIDSIASKYILPEEGTLDFALMYIPAENVYYETIIKDEMQSESLSSYALRKRVIPVSPNSIYAYLQAIVRGLKGLRIERSAQLILESLGQLEADFKKCLDDFEKVGGHLQSARSAYERTEKRLDKIHDKLASIEAQQPSEAVPATDPKEALPEDSLS